MGTMNVVADSLSKEDQVIGSDWTLVQVEVDYLLHCWPVTVDLFATALNYRLPNYYSPFNSSCYLYFAEKIIDRPCSFFVLPRNNARSLLKNSLFFFLREFI